MTTFIHSYNLILTQIHVAEVCQTNSLEQFDSLFDRIRTVSSFVYVILNFPNIYMAHAVGRKIRIFLEVC